MNNSVLLQYCRRLQAKDWRELDKFVRSPYFNQREDVVRLLEHLREQLPRPSRGGTALQKERVYAVVYPGEAYAEKRFRYLLSALLQLIKRYFVQREVEADPPQQQVHLCCALRRRRMERQFQQELDQAYKRLAKGQLRNPQYHYQQYLLKLEEARYTNTTLDHRRSGAELLEGVGNALTAFYIAELLRHGCDILALRSLQSHRYDLDFLEEVLRHVSQSEALRRVPAVQIYYHSYRAIAALDAEEAASEGHFQALKAGVQAHGAAFGATEIRDIYTLAVNYCIQRLNRGDRAYIREAFALYQSGLAREVWLENGVLSGYTYKNIARLGIALEEEAWVAQFIEDYRHYLPRREREQYWHYNLAYLYFQKRDYHNAMQLLREIEFRDVLNNLDTRRMLLRCYYELNELYALEYLLDSFQKYIQRQKAIGYHKNNYLNLIRFVRKKLQVADSNREALGRLAREVEQTEQVAEKVWLLEQLKR